MLPTAILLVSTAATTSPAWLNDNPAITVEQFLRMREVPLESYVCPPSDGSAFRDFSRLKAQADFGKPDRVHGPAGRGKKRSLGWEYFVTTNRSDATWSLPRASFILWFGPGDTLSSVSCHSHKDGADLGWSDSRLGPLIINPPSQSTSEQVPAAPPGVVGEIRRIIYSDLSKDEMLARLAKFVAVGDKSKLFKRRTGLDSGFCLVGGPGVQECDYLELGLEIVSDPTHRVRVIRRLKGTESGKDYPEMSISVNGFEWDGYHRWYSK